MIGAPLENGFQLVLVRHGVTDWNEQGKLLGRVDIGLNDRGRLQAQHAAIALESIPLAAVYSSPQTRTVQTAQPIAEGQGVEVQVDAGLDEVWLAKEWQGKTVRDLAGDENLERLIEDPTHHCGSIEPLEDVQRRSVFVAERLRSENPGKTMALVSHGDPLRTIVAFYLGMELTEFRRLAIQNGSITIVRFSSRGPQVTLLNWMPAPI
jgi:broad specificity phosphatase PhoE